jgi:hypothetical protein
MIPPTNDSTVETRTVQQRLEHLFGDYIFEIKARHVEPPAIQHAVTDTKVLPHEMAERHIARRQGRREVQPGAFPGLSHIFLPLVLFCAVWGRGVNGTAGIEQGFYLPMDVELALPAFMVEGLPDPARYVLRRCLCCGRGAVPSFRLSPVR